MAALDDYGRPNRLGLRPYASPAVRPPVVLRPTTIGKSLPVEAPDVTDRETANDGESTGVDEAPGVRCWLVARTVDDRDLVTLVYATEDGARYLRRERNLVGLRAGNAPTAATEVDPESLEPVPDESTRERYAAEAARVAAAHDPDDPI